MHRCQFAAVPPAKSQGQDQGRTKPTPASTTSTKVMLVLLVFQVIVIASSSCTSLGDRLEQQVALALNPTSGASPDPRTQSQLTTTFQHGGIGVEATSGSEKSKYSERRHGSGRHVTDNENRVRLVEHGEGNPAALFDDDARNFRRYFPVDVMETNDRSSNSGAGGMQLTQSSNGRDFQIRQPDGILAETAVVAARRDQIKASGGVSRPVFNPTGW